MFTESPLIYLWPVNLQCFDTLAESQLSSTLSKVFFLVPSHALIPHRDVALRSKSMLSKEKHLHTTVPQFPKPHHLANLLFAGYTKDLLVKAVSTITDKLLTGRNCHRMKYCTVTEIKDNLHS